MHRLHLFFVFIIDIIFPQSCIGCGVHRFLLCPQCGNTLPRATSSPYPNIVSVFDYQNKIIRKSIWKFKYKNARGFAGYFGKQLYEEIIGNLGEELSVSKKETFVIVPIPLHKKRLRQRGYNQSELLVQEIIKNDRENLFTYSPLALIRTRETKPQAQTEKRATRLENLRGAFQAKKDLVCGKNVILVDDVTTTGATLQEAHKALRAVGAKSVYAYTVAH